MRTLLLLMLLGPQMSPSAAQQPQPVQPSVGTLEIDATLPIGSARGDYFEAGWLFVDGRFLGRLPVKRTVTLDWGSHDLRVVIGAYTDERPRYFTVSWPRYFMNRGTAQAFQPAAVIEAVVNGQPRPPGVEFVASPEPRMLTEWRAFTGTDLSHVQQAARRLTEQPAGTPRVRIAVSPRVGGPREFDADQLRFFNRVLRDSTDVAREEVDRVFQELMALLGRK